MDRVFARIKPYIALPALLALAVCVFVAAGCASGRSGRIAGDLNGDGAVQPDDARAIMRAVLSLSRVEDEFLPLADLDGNGVLRVSDAELALGMAVSQQTGGERHVYKISVFAEPTCTAEGQIGYKCTRCGAGGTLAAPKIPHKYGSPKITKPTCVAVGETVLTCKMCGREERRVLPMTEHTWVEATASRPKHCSVCGLTLSGWTEIRGEWYYYDENGQAATGRRIVDGRVYRFSDSGVSATGREGEDPLVCVIGDSLVQALGNSGAAPYDFYGVVSLHVGGFTSHSAPGRGIAVIDEVRNKDYDIVVVLVGVNDLGSEKESWGRQYRDLLEGVKARAPGALVYAHSVLPVNEARAAASGYSCKMYQINALNAVIREVAEGMGVGYLDAVSALSDASGQLPYGASNDGIHIGSAYAATWYAWISKAF